MFTPEIIVRRFPRVLDVRVSKRRDGRENRQNLFVLAPKWPE
jgi:hypothetical protein